MQFFRSTLPSASPLLLAMAWGGLRVTEKAFLAGSMLGGRK